MATQVKKKYYLNPDYNGKVLCDSDGSIVLSVQLSQAKLKKLYAKGYKEFIEYR